MGDFLDTGDAKNPKSASKGKARRRSCDSSTDVVYKPAKTNKRGKTNENEKIQKKLNIARDKRIKRYKIEKDKKNKATLKYIQERMKVDKEVEKHRLGRKTKVRVPLYTNATREPDTSTQVLCDWGSDCSSVHAYEWWTTWAFFPSVLSNYVYFNDDNFSAADDDVCDM